MAVPLTGQDGNPHRDWIEVPIPPRRHSVTASTCYATGGMLTLMQENFLVISFFLAEKYIIDNNVLCLMFRGSFNKSSFKSNKAPVSLL